MKKLKNMFRQHDFHVCMAFLFFMLICLPFLIFPEKNETVNMFNRNMFLYFFMIWGAVVGLLFLMAASLGGSDAEDTDDEDSSPDV